MLSKLGYTFKLLDLILVVLLLIFAQGCSPYLKNLGETIPDPPPLATFKTLDLEGYFNGKHTTHLKEFFASNEVKAHEVPFQIKLTGSNTLITPVNQKQSIRIWIRERNIRNIHLIGYGTYLGERFGHKHHYCNDINHFSFTVKYSDGTIVEKFPYDVATGKKEWADILRREGAIWGFEATPIAYIHHFYIPMDTSKQIEYISMNDKHEKGQYVVYAITLQRQQREKEKQLIVRSDPAGDQEGPNYLDVLSVKLVRAGNELAFEFYTTARIPESPDYPYIAYIFSIDPDVGESFDSKYNIRIFNGPHTEGWKGTVRDMQGTDELKFVPITISGKIGRIVANIPELSAPTKFEWFLNTFASPDHGRISGDRVPNQGNYMFLPIE